MKVLPAASLAVVLACSCVSASAQSDSQRPLPVYDSTQIALGSYTVIKRIWVEGWRSALGVPRHRDEKAARTALLEEAVRLGADGVVNLYCLGQTDALFNPAGYYCYGNAIRFKKDRRAA